MRSSIRAGGGDGGAVIVLGGEGCLGDESEGQGEV